jgi:hypothetical protein
LGLEEDVPLLLGPAEVVIIVGTLAFRRMKF